VPKDAENSIEAVIANLFGTCAVPLPKPWQPCRVPLFWLQSVCARPDDVKFIHLVLNEVVDIGLLDQVWNGPHPFRAVEGRP
jgi:hypothetical protein